MPHEHPSEPNHGAPGQLEAPYCRAVNTLLTDLLSREILPRDIFPKMRGVFPADLIRYESDLKARCNRENVENEASEYNPQLHALAYEWYFTSDVASALSKEIVSRRGKTICLGVPTVALAAIKNSVNVVLVDQNSHVLNRFPELRQIEVHIMDAAEAGRLRVGADVVLFDSPWYLGDTLAWLLAAFRLVKQGGTIVFAMFPSLVRPAASSERELILELAESMGKVHVAEDALGYETPLFEIEALKACGLRSVGNWRRGDLVIISDRKPIGRQRKMRSLHVPKSRQHADGLWTTFLVGSQTVKLRTSKARSAGSRRRSLLRPVDGGFVLPSVSVRNTRRREIDLWTSRNRVAGVTDFRLLSTILQQLEAGTSFNRIIRHFRGRVGKASEMDLRTVLMEH